MMKLRALAKQLSSLAATDLGEGLLTRRNVLLGSALMAASGDSTARSAPSAVSTRWLVDRVTMGWTPQEQLLADTYGYHGYLEYQLNHEAINDSEMSPRLSEYFALGLTPYALHQFHASIIINQLIQTTLLRAVYSKRQLYERMVEFWSDHLNMDITKADLPWYKIADDRDVVRPNALGNFKDLIIASAKSPSMLQYLDNASSYAGNPNENYARELMELHTMGVSGGYTQQDVVEVARCFTGWTVDDTETPTKGTFVFRPEWHDTDPKTVLGQSIPAGGGMSDALTVIDILCAHSSTANFIATKLCKRFYGYDPPAPLINSVAATYSATSGDIKSMLRTFFSNVNPQSAPVKIKRPFHMFVSALRAVAAEITGDAYAYNSDVRTILAAAGHEPFYWGPPDGYPDSLVWTGLVLPRWNFAAELLNGDLDGVSVDIDAFLGGASTAQEIANKIDLMMFGGALPSAEKNRIRDYLLPDPPSTQRKREAVGLAVSTPTFQWY
jgi:hypothetical protein